MKPWPKKVGALDAAFGVILALLGVPILVALMGTDALGGYLAGLLIGALALLIAEGR